MAGKAILLEPSVVPRHATQLIAHPFVVPRFLLVWPLSHAKHPSTVLIGWDTLIRILYQRFYRVLKIREK